MQIVLVRHAKVLADNKQKIYAGEIPKWVKAYNQTPVDNALPKEELVTQMKSAGVILASSLSRTEDSLALLDIKPHEKNALFDEAEVPRLSMPWLKLKPSRWLVLLRLLMFSRIGSGNESFKHSKVRAKEAANYLMQLAKEKESVVLVGHGGMNWLMGKSLEKSAWTCVKDVKSARNWGYKVYTKKTL